MANATDAAGLQTALPVQAPVAAVPLASGKSCEPSHEHASRSLESQSSRRATTASSSASSSRGPHISAEGRLRGFDLVRPLEVRPADPAAGHEDGESAGVHDPAVGDRDRLLHTAPLRGDPQLRRGDAHALMRTLSALQNNNRDLPVGLLLVAVVVRPLLVDELPDRSRSSPCAARARAGNTSSSTCSSTFGSACRFWYQSGCSGAPPFDATIT